MSKKKKSRWTLPKQQNRALASQELARFSAVGQAEVLPPTSDSPISPAKLEANRLNAQLSSGPVTETGKEIVSMNAVKHGLAGNKFRVLANESQAEFDHLLAGFLAGEAPVGEDEIAMVHQMAECVWLSRRSVRMQNDCWAVLESGADEERRAAHKSMALYLRYQSTDDRTFTRYATELRKRRNERRKAECGFVSQKHKEAAEARRVTNEIRKQEIHELRRQTIILRQQRIETGNQLAATKVNRQKNARRCCLRHFRCDLSAAIPARFCTRGPMLASILMT